MSNSAETRSFEYNTHSVDVVAIKPIMFKKEITISYVDPKLNLYRRRRQLQCDHLFKCVCSRCVEEEKEKKKKKNDSLLGVDGDGDDKVSDRISSSKEIEDDILVEEDAIGEGGTGIDDFLACF